MKRIKLFLKNWFIYYPKCGDKVYVPYVGFGGSITGIVSSVHKDNVGIGYCWIDVFNFKGEYINSYTASFSYCTFIFI